MTEGVTPLDFGNIFYGDNQLGNGLVNLMVAKVSAVEDFKGRFDEALGIVDCPATQIHELRFRAVVARIEIIRIELISTIQARLQTNITINLCVINVDAEANHLAAVVVLVLYAGFQSLGKTTLPKVGGGVDHALFGGAELSLQDQVGKVKNTAVAIYVNFLLRFNSPSVAICIERDFKADFPAFICTEGEDSLDFCGVAIKIFRFLDTHVSEIVVGQVDSESLCITGVPGVERLQFVKVLLCSPAAIVGEGCSCTTEKNAEDARRYWFILFSLLVILTTDGFDFKGWPRIVFIL